MIWQTRIKRTFGMFHFAKQLFTALYSVKYAHYFLSVGDKVGESSRWRGCPRCVTVKAMDSGIAVSEFELQSRYYVHFRINILRNVILILPAMGYIIPLLFF